MKRMLILIVLLALALKPVGVEAETLAFGPGLAL